MNEKNLRNIKTIFEERTGVSLQKTGRNIRLHRIPVLAAAIVCLLAVSAAAVSGFSALEGDALALSAEYRGDGIVAVTAENLSRRTVTFQEEVSLRYWNSAQIVPIDGENAVFSRTSIPGGETGEILIDLSGAYDIEHLETLPQGEDSYCLSLTNDRFIFGNTWVVEVPMASSAQTDTPEPLFYTDADILENMEPSLRFYYEEYTEFLSPEWSAMNQEYQIAYLTLLSEFEGTVVSPIENPLGTNEFIYYYDCEESLFDPWHSGFEQFKLVWDGYPAHFGLYKKVLSAFEHPACFEIQAIIPSRNDEDPTDMTSSGGSTIPLLWLFTYPAAMALPENYAFINGQLVTFAEMEDMKVYEDADYVCYEISPLIYSDLDAYLARCCAWFGYDHYTEEMDARVKNIHAFYTEHLPEMICYMEDIWATRDAIDAAEGEPDVSEN